MTYATARSGALPTRSSYETEICSLGFLINLTCVQFEPLEEAGIGVKCKIPELILSWTFIRLSSTFVNFVNSFEVLAECDLSLIQ